MRRQKSRSQKIHLRSKSWIELSLPKENPNPSALLWWLLPVDFHFYSRFSLSSSRNSWRRADSKTRKIFTGCSWFMLPLERTGVKSEIGSLLPGNRGLIGLVFYRNSK